MSLAGARHVRPAGHHPRGEETRRRLIESAIETFAAHGYEGATTRVLAERAHVALPAIQYHFGGKEGLYRAVVEHIVAWIDARMAPPTEHIAAVLEGDRRPSRAGQLGLLQELLDLFVVLANGDEHPESWHLFLSRSEIETNAVLAPLRETVMRRVISPCAALIGSLTGRSAADEETLLRSLALIGLATVFSRTETRRALGWSEVGEDRIRAIQAVLHRQMESLLSAAAPHSAGGARP